MAKRLVSTTEERPKSLAVVVLAPGNSSYRDDYIREFESLLSTLGAEYDGLFVTKLRQIEKSTFLTTGKLFELQDKCEREEYERIYFSEILSPLQERNISDATGCEVFDRERVIIEIFKNAATSAEGKLQVEMAELQYLKSRLAGMGKEMSQQEGVVGTRGPGETGKEVLRRHIEQEILRAKKRLDALSRTRAVQRKRRISSGLPLVSLVGYTNAGKSTILNALTHSEVLAENKLFATLDTTTRSLFYCGRKIALISDTVGFITNLPHKLVAAFKSTLDELKYSKLLLHVIDASNASWRHQVDVVHETLDEIGAQGRVLPIFNKIDKLEPAELELLKLESGSFDNSIFISARSKEDIERLRTEIAALLEQRCEQESA